MYIKKCPKCGRIPDIIECVPTKTGVRRRMCKDPCYQGKLDNYKLRSYNQIEMDCTHYSTCSFVFVGEGDDNAIYKIWNEALIDG